MPARSTSSGDPREPERRSALERLELRVAAIPAVIPRLRHALTQFAGNAGVPAPDEVALAVTEAVTNSVLHAYRDEDEPGEVRVVACDEPGRLVVVVRDYGSGLAPRSDSPGLGMGLSIIGRLASLTSLERPDDGGTRVRMHFQKTSVPGLCGAGA